MKASTGRRKFSRNSPGIWTSNSHLSSNFLGLRIIFLFQQFVKLLLNRRRHILTVQHLFYKSYSMFTSDIRLVFCTYDLHVGLLNYPELLQELPEVALRAYSKINRDRRAPLVSSNRDRFAHYRYYSNISHSLYAGGPINASFGFWAGAIICLIAKVISLGIYL